MDDDDDDKDDILKRWIVKQAEMREKAIFRDDDYVHELMNMFSSKKRNIQEENEDKEENAEQEKGNEDEDDFESPVRRRIERLENSKIRLSVVGGIDVSFKPGGDGSEGIATLVVLSYPCLEVLGSSSRHVRLKAPYIPSFLSLRESGPLVQLLEDTYSPSKEENDNNSSSITDNNNNDNLKENPTIVVRSANLKQLPKPEIIFVDGNGRLHEREMGLATALGVLSGYPTIGIGKDYHPVIDEKRDEKGGGDTTTTINNNSTTGHFRSSQKGFKHVCKTLLHDRGDWIGIYGRDRNVGYVGGALLSSPDSSSKGPIFVSPGHRISLSSSLKLTLECCKTGRVPDPVRHADMISRQLAREWDWSSSSL